MWNYLPLKSLGLLALFLSLFFVAPSFSQVDAPQANRPSNSQVDPQTIDASDPLLSISLEPGEGVHVFAQNGESKILIYQRPPSSNAQNLRVDLRRSAPASPLNQSVHQGAGSWLDSRKAYIQIAKYKGWLVDLGTEARGAAFAMWQRQVRAGKQGVSGKNLRVQSRSQIYQASDSAFNLAALRFKLGLRLLRKDLKVVQRTFRNSFSGYLVNGLAHKDLTLLKQRGLVKRFLPNYEVQASTLESASQIGAPQLWSLGYHGEGIKIGIIDTGVDYRHSDFRGCTTASFLAGNCAKVRGGYDFVDNDSDPVDCYGHGTHVASIAAGLGASNGIAPAAQLVPIRVLDCSGLGSESNILAGIEYSLDPNGDGDLSDHLDVINLSLGARGDPDDIMSKALDGAAEAGVVPVASAGNNGFGPIGSPGTSREAITVGAVDADNNPASFTSTGPVVWKDDSGVTHVLVKPDISAPGVGICAARAPVFPDNGSCSDSDHIAFSGTSMAAPHVAGGAALLREMHPEWDVSQIKTALLQGAFLRPEQIQPFRQGMGLVDLAASSGIANPLGFELNPIAYRVRRPIISAKVSDPSRVASFTVELGEMDAVDAPLPTAWEELASGEGFPADGVLSNSIDTFTMPNGVARLLRASLRTYDGQTYTRYGILGVLNFTLKSPFVGQLVSSTNPIEFKIEKSVDYPVDSVEISVDDSAGGRTVLPSSLRQVDSTHVVATVSPNAITSFGQRQVHVTLISTDVTNEVDLPITFDPDIRPGFPVHLPVPMVDWGDGVPVPTNPGLSFVGVGDLLGDSKKELVYLENGAPPKAFIISSSGEVLESFPLSSSPDDHSFVEVNSAHALADLDGDGKDDIVVSTFNGETRELSINAFRPDGQELPGWPVTIASGFALGGDFAANVMVQRGAAPDGGPMILTASKSGTKITAFDSHGRQLWQRFVGNSGCGLVKLSSDTTFLANFGWNPFSTPVFTDVMGDCQLEIVAFAPEIRCQDGSEQVSVDKNVTILSLGGEQLASFPVAEKLVENIRSSGWPTPSKWETHFDPLVVDVLGDGKKEIITSDTASGVSINALNGESLGDLGLNQGRIVVAQPFPLLSGLLSSKASIAVPSSDLQYGFGTQIDIAGRSSRSILTPQYGQGYLTVGSVDGGNPGLLSTDWLGLSGFTGSGSPLRNFPKSGMLTQYLSPYIGDLDGDGKLELMEIGFDATPGSEGTDIYVFNTSSPIFPVYQSWPQFRANSALTGEVPAPFDLNDDRRIDMNDYWTLLRCVRGFSHCAGAYRLQDLNLLYNFLRQHPEGSCR